MAELPWAGHAGAMSDLDEQDAITLGGWDARYAVVLAVATRGPVAAAIVDTNGDDADVDLDVYSLGHDGAWVAGSSGNGGVGGGSSDSEIATISGWAAPGSTVTVEHGGTRYDVVTAPTGCWLFVAPSDGVDEIPRLVQQPEHG